jgi:hypothetical protein
LINFIWPVGGVRSMGGRRPGTRRTGTRSYSLLAAVKWPSFGATITTTGLTVAAQLGTAPLPDRRQGQRPADENLPIARDPWHGEWNYTISAHSVLA